jgi:hypothetical protein
MVSKVKALGIDIPATLRGRANDGFAYQFGYALPYSFKIDDARSFTGGIVHPCSAEPTAAQPRDLFQCSAASNSRSRSICALRLAGTSGSGFSDARSLSPISRTMARLCTWSMSIRLRMAAPSFRQHAVHSPRNRPGHCWRF